MPQRRWPWSCCCLDLLESHAPFANLPGHEPVGVPKEAKPTPAMGLPPGQPSGNTAFSLTMAHATGVEGAGGAGAAEAWTVQLMYLTCMGGSILILYSYTVLILY
jgi:hypothetical protein